ncbi:hypothetical protein [Gracilimonas sp. BCB1]|uniref:hypothetical protein n=1 Tax=Gracilimonas sp. BCB1 TaxID=3152362 RepID=UPI0032DD24B7
MITGVLFCISHTLLAQNTHEKELVIRGEPMLSSDQIIADREVNYDVNGQLAAGVLIKTSLKDLNIESTLGVLSIMGYENSVLILLSPEESKVNIYKEGIEPLNILLSEAGIDLESGKVWEIEVTEQLKKNTSDELTVVKDLEFLKNELVANRRDNKNAEGILAAGLKIYSDRENLEVAVPDSDKLLKIQKAENYYLIYILPGVQEVRISMPGKKPLTINLAQTTLESGRVYSLRVE